MNQTVAANTTGGAWTVVTLRDRLANEEGRPYTCRTWEPGVSLIGIYLTPEGVVIEMESHRVDRDGHRLGTYYMLYDQRNERDRRAFAAIRTRLGIDAEN